MTEHLNKNRGHAFVEYQDPSHAKEAVKHLNGYSLQDTKIKVQFNTKQPPWYAGNGHNNRSMSTLSLSSLHFRDMKPSYGYCIILLPCLGQ